MSNHSTQYQKQLAEKYQLFTTLMQEFRLPKNIQLFESEEENFRMRTEFRIWHEGEKCFYVMFEPGKKASSETRIIIEQFPIAYHTINNLMQPLLCYIEQEACLKNKLYQIEFLTTLNEETIISLIYHRHLDNNWYEASLNLAQQFNISVIGRSRGQKIVIGQDYVEEILHVNGEDFYYRQYEGSFSQPNAKICEKMLTWASQCTANIGGDFLELYCGNGNFSFPLSRHFQQALATEISQSSIKAGLWGKEKNHCHQLKLVRMSAEEFGEAIKGKRVFRRLQEQNIDLSDYQFSTVLVDPPRAGLTEATCHWLSQFDNILYISCNPYTLQENLRIFTQTHNILQLALFDQFPFTPHIESGVLLRKKDDKKAIFA